jgi:hypothetical protein
MKTVKSIAVAIFTLATLSSCSNGQDSNEAWYNENLEVMEEDWVLVGKEDEIGTHFEYIFDDFPYVNGIVTVYMYRDFGSRWEKQVPLPYTEYGIDFLDDGREKDYSIQYSYDIGLNGTITLKVYVSDYRTLGFSPGTQHFRVAIIW